MPEPKRRLGPWLYVVAACGGLYALMLFAQPLLSLFAPPTPAPEPPPPPGPLAGVTVVVDPGHGGIDKGACHFPSNLIEKEINLDMALRLEQALLAAEATVHLTRRDDTLLSLDERRQFANDREADLFVSLHVNRFPSQDCFGAQTFFLPASESSRTFAVAIQEHLLQVYPPNYRQAMPANFRVLRGANMPAALVEIGFVTSPVDRALIQQTEYRDDVARAIVEACIRYLAEAGDREGA